MSESPVAKIAVVVGIGAVVFGGFALRERYFPHERPGAAELHAGTVPSAAPVAPIVTPPPLPAPAPASSSAQADAAPLAPSVTAADRAALLDAAAAGDRLTVEALVARGVPAEGTLENAARSKNAALVEWLLGHGVAATEGEDLSVPPLLLADESEAITGLLLARGAHEPTLARAVTAGAPRAVTRLLAKGQSANGKTTEGEPVLLAAVRESNGAARRGIVDALLKAGADPDAKAEGESPLAVAIAKAAHPAADAADKTGDRPIDLVARLVAARAKVDGDALVLALGAEEPPRGALLDALLAAPAPSLDRAATAKAIAVAASARDVASIKKLAAKRIAWATLDPGAPLPLTTAALAGDVDVTRALLEAGASPNTKGGDGRTPLFVAAQQGDETLVALLVSKGARVDEEVLGLTPLEAAEARGNDAVVKVLKARGAKVRKPPATKE
ncbi:MAG: uncharacterized protein JWP97_3726 [Labilithrix sp.]|nr:uncharacterized protein [Labilithrix sp.]